MDFCTWLLLLYCAFWIWLITEALNEQIHKVESVIQRLNKLEHNSNNTYLRKPTLDIPTNLRIIIDANYTNNSTNNL